MNCTDIKPFLAEVIEEFGENPYGFFNILRDSDNPVIDIFKANESLESLKSEEWHSLKMKEYTLWAISDNGDCLWWNGEQTVAMNPRSFEFMSLPVQPKQFIRLIGMGKVTGIFPEQLWCKNA